MEKRFFVMMAIALSAFAFSSCEYDDSELWDKVHSLEEQVQANTEEIATLSALVDALNDRKSVESVEATETGYTLTFNDGSTIEVKSGAYFVSVEEDGSVVYITLADGRVITLQKCDYELAVLTFEDEDVEFDKYKFFDDLDNEYTITKWSDLIPKEQYGDALIYGSAISDGDYMGSVGYNWGDGGRTYLYSCFVESYGSMVYWNGGQVVSNFYNADIKSATYEKQLEIAVGEEGAVGHEGSKNFCVHNGVASISFGDGIERVVDHMWVTNTNYVINSFLYGDGYSPVADEDSVLKIVALGYDNADNVTGYAEFKLCDGKDKIVTDWQMFDLSGLGSVAYIEFSIEGSNDLHNDFGLATPTYFAFDDVAVRIYE